MLLANSLGDLEKAARFLRVGRALLPLVFLLFIAALYAAFLFAPREIIMGEVQRIFYFHIGAAMGFYAAFAIVLVAGIAYLSTGKRIWDHVGASAAEIGLMLTTINLLTGMIWARPIWGTWWPWGDPRVTSVLILWLIFMAYAMLRSNLDEGERQYKLCAVFGIIGALDLPIIHMAPRVWRTIHPVVITMDEMKLENEMIVALFVAISAYLSLFAALFTLRLSMRLHKHAAEALRRNASSEDFER